MPRPKCERIVRPDNAHLVAETMMSSPTTAPATSASGDSTNKSSIEEQWKSLFDTVCATIVQQQQPGSAALSNQQRLQLYGRYKHITVGPCQTDSPGWWQPVAHAKHEAWRAVRHLTTTQACIEYIRLVLALAPDHAALQARFQELLLATESSEADNVPVLPELSEKDTPPQHLLVPRGQLDISYTDLCFGLAQVVYSACIPTSLNAAAHYQDKIANVWQQNDSKAVVGLSARSLLDLYLQAKAFPLGSRVLVTPPINIPDMMSILTDIYQLQVVAVDLPPRHDDDHEQGVVAVDLPAVQRLLQDEQSPPVVAILVVHVFGTIVTSEPEMAQLRAWADQYQVDVWEDCAECYTGLDGYRGSPHAHLSLFSFGTIKTATACGGGLAVVRSGQEAATMRRVQHTRYPVQSLVTYWNKLLVALVVCFITNHPRLYAWIWTTCQHLGINLDTLSRALLRSFPPHGGDSPAAVAQRLRQQIRRQPSLPLLKMMWRRMQQTDTTRRMVHGRIQAGTALTRALQPIVPPVATGAQCTYWLYPVQLPSCDAACRFLQAAGIDATTSRTHLTCIAPASCPRAQTLMQSLLYLPLHWSTTTTQLEKPTREFCHVRRTLQQWIQQAETKEDPPETAVTSTSLPQLRLAVPALAALVAFMIVVPMVLVVRLAVALAATVVVVVVAWYGLAYLLRVSMGSAYLTTCTAFRRHGPDFFGPAKKSNEEPPAWLRDWDLWKIPVVATAPGRKQNEAADKPSVVLTGGTGFVGSMLLRELAVHSKELNIARIVVICRAKRGETAQQRIEALLRGSLFENVNVSMIETMEGDVSQPHAGLSDIDIARLVNLKVSHVLHCAAVVSFTQSLPEAARSNISASLHVQALSRKISSAKARFVHLSTSFVHGGRTGSESDPLKEELFDLGRFDPMKLYQSMMGSEFYASKAMVDLQFPNTYTFSKSVCEHLLLSGEPDTVIFRPSIVGPALVYPYEGWAGSRPSTVVAAACLYFHYQWNLWCFGNHRVPCIPVDVLSRYAKLPHVVLRLSVMRSNYCAKGSWRGLDSKCQIYHCEMFPCCHGVRSFGCCRKH
jgi:perosamine synthetase